MHFEAVLFLVCLLRHLLKLSCVSQLFHGLRADSKVANGSLVGELGGEGTIVQIDMMRWSKKEDTLAVVVVSCLCGVKSISPSYHFVQSTALYAHAAAGPEYEYPACLYHHHQHP